MREMRIEGHNDCVKGLGQACFFLPKKGNTEDEYEDAFHLSATSNSDSQRYRFAVADGATETSFSGQWAKLLVNAFVSGDFDRGIHASSLEPLRRQWAEKVTSKDLPWYGEEKIRQGAYSSLLGLQLIQKGTRLTWEATAIGDSCLFHLRGRRLLTTFPIEHSADFDSRPLLLSSKPSESDLPLESVKQLAGDFDSADVFFLMTDALACWFLGRHEAGEEPWRALVDLAAEDQRHAFSDFICRLRALGEIRNDDVTLLRVEAFDFSAGKAND